MSSSGPPAGPRRPDPAQRSRLKALAALCTREAGVDGCGVSIRDSGGNPVTLHTTDDVAATIEDLQFTLGEGPCMEASGSGTAVLVADLHDPRDAAAGWPMFLSEATQVGVRAVFAFPVRVGAVHLGVVDLYRATPGPLSRRELSSTYSTVDMLGRHIVGLDRRQRGARESSYCLTVHQAAGMIMVQLGSGIDEALLRLRAMAYAEARPVAELAADVVAGRVRLGKEKT
jgi:hypothetical protein